MIDLTCSGSAQYRGSCSFRRLCTLPRRGSRLAAKWPLCLKEFARLLMRTCVSENRQRLKEGRIGQRVTARGMASQSVLTRRSTQRGQTRGHLSYKRLANALPPARKSPLECTNTSEIACLDPVEKQTSWGEGRWPTRMAASLSVESFGRILSVGILMTFCPAHLRCPIPSLGRFHPVPSFRAFKACRPDLFPQNRIQPISAMLGRIAWRPSLP